MIRINQIKLPIEHTEKQLRKKICKSLHISDEQLLELSIAKRSLDARKKPELQYVYSVDVSVQSEASVLKKVDNNNVMLTNPKEYHIPDANPAYFSDNAMQPVIVGAGPAGLFCAYALVQKGICPLVIERGRKIEERTEDVEKFWKTGVLDTKSNVQFGEGGAGTFSDGKLNTLVKDSFGRNRFVLETFVKFGAPEHILYENKPHIGTDILAKVIRDMRIYMEELGAKFYFETCLTDYRTANGKLCALELNHKEWLEADTVVLAIGHSARDTFRMLDAKRELKMEPKSFAVGFRVEHPQEYINRQQYGELYYTRLPAAPYKVTANLTNGRGVYSFCMCPGGYVVNASSEKGRLAVNGMSYSGRDGANANSAIIVSVSPNDFPGEDALSGVRFQEKLEERAYTLGNGKIPQQLFGDYCANQPSIAYGSFDSATKGAAVLCNLRGVLPEELEDALMEGMHAFCRAIPDFDRKDAILSGVESRTSSPVRIPRDEAFEAAVSGIYPCGEGAGYAGGIMSAAMDGLKVAEAILTVNRNSKQK
ncbi:MAG: NAD(P)-binding protein [Clostridiales bacterium]|nr:NAD(P)-binding protein [Roseburia sp.]MDD7638212.1 NAD(P)-binding protein [Clostridiales bacterium]MDY4114020.1 NAD(P)-binding protein [Roseburia sp.]